MTTSDSLSDFPQPPTSGHRLLRRNRTNRVAAGVASGLGEYFGIDPVLFRVLFATSAFFGGAGILAYVLAWAAIPEAGTARAPIDGWVAAARRRRIPVWLVVVVGGLLLWGVGLSWWLPGPFFPVVAVVVLLVVFFARRELQSPAPPPAADVAPVSLTKEDAPPPADQPPWVRDARAWLDEARALSRERRRRALPIRLGVVGALAVALTALGIADAVDGIQLQWYFWTTLIIVGAGMIAGLVSRRWSWSVVPLLVPAIVGSVAFAGSDASLHDGIGQREWRPTTATDSQYRLAFGQGVLDLRDLATPASPATIKVTLGAGQVKIIAPKTLNMTVNTEIHMGQLDVDEDRGDHGQAHGGVEFNRTIDPPAGATGAPITVDVDLTDGEVTVLHK
jgi:phage shock protein PspC (stress-responsive transcriptional regulator)/FtsH-binding integral membrane protein